MVYYIVTRDRVPSALLRKWRPSASARTSALDKGSDDEDESGADEGEVSSPFSIPVPFASTQPALAVGHLHDGSEDEEVISISGKFNFYLKSTG